MLKLKPFLPLLFLLLPCFVAGQNTKKPLDFSVYDGWERLQSEKISYNAQWISFEINPQKGDGVLHILERKTGKRYHFERGDKLEFSPNSDFAAFKVKVYADTIRQAKLDDKKSDQMPKDSLFIVRFNDMNIKKIERVKSFKLPREESSWMAYLLEKEKKQEEKDTAQTSEEESGEELENQEENKKEKKEKDKKKDKKAPDATTLIIFQPVKEKQYRFDNVCEYEISRNGEFISFIKLQNDTILKSTVYIFDTKKEKLDSIFSEQGLAKKLTNAHYTKQMAFIHTADTIDTKTYSLYFWNEKNDRAHRIADTLTAEIPEKWTVSENSRLHFSRDDKKLFFGTAQKPEPEPEDTLLEEEKVHLDIWHWKDKRLQPQQKAEKKRDEKQTYMAVFYPKTSKIVQIEDENFKEVRTIQKGNADIAFATDRQKYMHLISWEYPYYKDVYTVDLKTGKRTLVLEKTQSWAQLSAGGKYVLWYENADSTWHSHEVATGKKQALTNSLNVNFFDETHDYPSDPYPYGIDGWTENDQYVLLRDRYDIWKIDPSGKEKPQNLTKSFGRENKIRFRFVQLDPEADWIDPKKDLMLKAFNESTKQDGYFSTTLKANQPPEQLIMEDKSFSYRPQKAKHQDLILWQKSDVKNYPDLWVSRLNFSDAKKLTAVNAERQKNYVWANVELVKWNNMDGDQTHGLLYKPENFDPSKKYPMMVYFYRRHSDNLHHHYTPYPSRSIINPLFYVSNGYLVFMPDIKYKIGYPGESSFNHVVSGTLAMIAKGFVDKQAIGIQGQSWGGYQTAYIVTKTDLYKAASPGAPVSNMTSAYGGIRWRSGMSRMFQYEQTQSRIGGTLWEKPLHYIENSPVFYVPKINTPMLIRHDDADGAVPWYQGIELFVAMRRLQKPAWLINYNNAPHNLTKKRSNQKDWSKRMWQFFEHYLRDEPAPPWLEKGVPAIEKGKNFGF